MRNPRLWVGLALSLFALYSAFRGLDLAQLGDALTHASYIGTYHASVILALSVFGIAQADALAYALILHAASFAPLLIIGAIYLWREGLSLGQLTHRRRGGGLPQTDMVGVGDDV